MRKIELLPYQTELVADFDNLDRILCLWGRMTGKTFMAGYLAAKYCYRHTGVDVAVVTPYPFQGLFLQQMAAHYAETRSFWCKVKRGLRCLWKRIQRKQYESRFSIIRAVSHACVGLHFDVVIFDGCEMIPEPIFEIAKLMLAPDGKIVLFSNATYTDHWIHKLFKSKQFYDSRVKTCENPNIDPKMLHNVQKMIGIDEFDRNFCINFKKRPKKPTIKRKPDYAR